MLSTTQARRLNYLSGAHHENTAAVAHEAGIGLLNTWKIGYSTATMARYPFFALDCAAFSIGARWEDFNFGRWVAWTEKRIAQLRDAGILDRLLFVVVPDAITVTLVDGRPNVESNGAETLERFRTWAPWVRSLGAPTALVIQPGMRPSDIPWDLVDWVFLGGTDEWKEGPQARRATELAHRLGKQVHMGRVNTRRRLEIAADFGCDTADGTKCGKGNDKNLGQLVEWLDELAA